MKRNPPWQAGLDSGAKCHSFAIVYDTVYDLLTPEERKRLAARCAEEGILPVLNDWVPWVIFALAGVAAFRYKLNAAYLVVGGAVLGWLAGLL